MKNNKNETHNQERYLRVATLQEFKKKNVMVISGSDRPIAVFYNKGEVMAVDNRYMDC